MPQLDIIIYLFHYFVFFFFFFLINTIVIVNKIYIIKENMKKGLTKILLFFYKTFSRTNNICCLKIFYIILLINFFIILFFIIDLKNLITNLNLNIHYIKYCILNNLIFKYNILYNNPYVFSYKQDNILTNVNYYSVVSKYFNQIKDFIFPNATQAWDRQAEIDHVTPFTWKQRIKYKQYSNFYMPTQWKGVYHFVKNPLDLVYQDYIKNPKLKLRDFSRVLDSLYLYHNFMSCPEIPEILKIGKTYRFTNYITVEANYLYEEKQLDPDSYSSFVLHFDTLVKDYYRKTLPKDIIPYSYCDYVIRTPILSIEPIIQVDLLEDFYKISYEIFDSNKSGQVAHDELSLIYNSYTKKYPSLEYNKLSFCNYIKQNIIKSYNKSALLYKLQETSFYQKHHFFFYKIYLAYALAFKYDLSNLNITF